MATVPPFELIQPLNVHLPWDIISCVIRAADYHTLKILNLVSKDFEYESGRRLWRVISIFTLGQSLHEARQHVSLKLDVFRRHVKHVDEVRLGAYSAYCPFWQSEEAPSYLRKLFCLLHEAKIGGLTVSLITKCPSMRSIFETYGLPSDLRSLHLSAAENDLGQVEKSLHTLEFLQLRSVPNSSSSSFYSSSVIPKPFPLPPKSVFSALRTLELDNPRELRAIHSHYFPALENFSLSGITRASMDTIIPFLLSLSSSPKCGYSPHTPHPTLRSLSLRVAIRSEVQPSGVSVYSSILLHPLIQASKALAHIEALELLHEALPSQSQFDDTILELLEAFPNLKRLRCDILVHGMDYTSYCPRSVGERVLKVAFGTATAATAGRGRMEEIVLKPIAWRIEMFQPCPWIRRYKARCGGQEGEMWEMLDDCVNLML